jgi:hypothetical protein
LYQAWMMMMMMMMIVEQLVEWMSGRENRSNWEKTCSSAALSIAYPHLTWPGLEAVPPRWEAGDYLPKLRHRPSPQVSYGLLPNGLVPLCS